MKKIITAIFITISFSVKAQSIDAAVKTEIKRQIDSAMASTLSVPGVGIYITKDAIGRNVVNATAVPVDLTAINAAIKKLQDSALVEQNWRAKLKVVTQNVITQ